MNILITGAFSALNKGDAARVTCAVAMIKKLMPDACFGFWSTQPQVDRAVYAGSGIQIEEKYRYASRAAASRFAIVVKALELCYILVSVIVWRALPKPVSAFFGRQLGQYDMFLDISGESLSDYYGWGNLMRCLYSIFIGIMSEKQVVIFAQTIGPYDNRLGRALATFVLNRVDLITVRDESSLDYLRDYKVDVPPVHLTADPAFVLEPAFGSELDAILEAEGIRKPGRRLLGMAISRGAYSHSISRKGNLDKLVDQSLEVIGEFVDYAIDQLNAQVIFIPHTVAPCEDDRDVFDRLQRHVKTRNLFKAVPGHYDSREMKGVIACCDLFIGSRMHANISALSSLVPTLAIAYSDKMPSLMGMLGQGEYVCYVENLTLDVLTAKVNALWHNRKIVQQELRPKIERMRRNSIRNAELVRDLFHRKVQWHPDGLTPCDSSDRR